MERKRRIKCLAKAKGAALTATSHNASAKDLQIDWRWDQHQGATIPANARARTQRRFLATCAKAVGHRNRSGYSRPSGFCLGFYLPTIAARWSGPETMSQEFWLQLRFTDWLCICLDWHCVPSLWRSAPLSRPATAVLQPQSMRRGAARAAHLAKMPELLRTRGD